MTLPHWAPLPDGLSQAQRQLVTELRALKDRHALTFKQMGRLTHYSHASWERWLNGKRPVTRQALESLVSALALDGAHLLQALEDIAQSADAGGPSAASLPHPAATRRDTPGVAQLPLAVSDFVGRREQTRRLAQLLVPGEREPGTVPLAVLTGGGGLGKTALAVRVCHLMAHHFPDGQLYADLRGTSDAPRGPQDVLAGWLRALGDDAGAIPLHIEEMAARFRSLLAGRRFLLLLDDARDAAQIRPLLPASSGCAVVVTSRTRLAGLAGVVVEVLDVLSDEDAGQLFAAIVGGDRVAAEPRAAQSILASCAGLPLAVRIAASRLAGRPEWTLAHMAQMMADEAGRLDTLQVEDVAVRSVFQLSYGHLTVGRDGVDAAHAFRLLGLFPTPDIALPAASALLGTSVRACRHTLESLVDAHLLGTPAPDRYRMHDLLRAFALEGVMSAVDPAERRAAAGRLVAWYVHATEKAMDRIHPLRTRFPVDTVAEHGPEVRFGSRREALVWCDSERLNLAAAIRLADALGMTTEAWLLPASLLHYDNLAHLLPDWLDAFSIGLRNAERAGATVGQAWMLGGLSTVRRLGGDHQQALRYSRQALELSRSVGDRAGQATYLSNTASILLLMGRVRDAITHYERALHLRLQAGTPSGVVATLNNLGHAHERLGSHAQALNCYQEALERCGRHPMPLVEAAVLDGVGTASAALGDGETAVEALRQAVALRDELSDTANLPTSLLNLANALEQQQRYAEAQDCRVRAGALRPQVRENCPVSP